MIGDFDQALNLAILANGLAQRKLIASDILNQ